MQYKLEEEKRVASDIKEAIDWYESKQKHLGLRFYDHYLKHMEILKINPHFQVRYNKVRCLPFKKFPFMLHFSLDEINRIVKIHAVLHTSLDPKKWKI